MRRPVLRALSSVAIAFTSVMASAQTPSAPTRVDSRAAMAQIVKRVEPVFPPDIVAANPGAPFAADLIIRVDGSVESVIVIIGPDSLKAPAVAALKQWTFKPFTVGGRPARVIALIDIPLPDPAREAERKAADAYFLAQPACTRSVVSRAVDAVRVCTDLVRLADSLPADHRHEKSESHAFLGFALLQQDKALDALTQFETALSALQRKVPDADADDADLLAVIARVHDRLGHFSDADRYFKDAVDTFERAIVAVPQLQDNYKARLSTALRDYAAFKRATGAIDDARALDTKAEALKAPPPAPMPAPVQIGGVLYLAQTAGSLTEDDVRQIRALIPQEKKIWFLQTGADRISPGNRWVALAFLEPDAVRPGLRRGPIVELSAALAGESDFAGRKVWRKEPMFNPQFAQVPMPGRAGTDLRGQDDRNRPFELKAIGTNLVSDADVLSVVALLRSSEKASAGDRSRLFLDPQPWPIDEMFFLSDRVDVFLREGLTIGGPGQHITLKRVLSGWTIVELQPGGGGL